MTLCADKKEMLTLPFGRPVLHRVKALTQSCLKERFMSTTTSCLATGEKTVAIRREESSVWERRAPLSPSHVQVLIGQGLKVRGVKCILKVTKFAYLGDSLHMFYGASSCSQCM